MPSYLDQLWNPVNLSETPKRIVSVVPSQTELLAHLGLEKEVVGITKFCVRPADWFKSKERIGGTKNLHLEKIRALKPDLIFANKEENTKEQIEELQKDFPVWISEVKTLQDALDMIDLVGLICDKSAFAERLNEAVRKRFFALSKSPNTIKAAYFIWRKPYMTIGGDTFINEMMQWAGFENIFRKEKRYPAVEVEEIKALRPDCLLLSSEPFPFKQKHIDELRNHFPKIPIKIVDGEFFSWYGSRLLHAPDYFRKLKNDIFE